MWRKRGILLCLAMLLGTAGPTAAALVGHWPMNEGAGAQAADTTGNNHNGTINGATWVSPGRDGTGSCLQFDGVDDVVVVPDAPGLRFGINSKYTLAAWVNWTILPGQWLGVVTKGREVGNWYGIWLDPSNRWVFGHATNQLGSVTTANVWIHVAMVYDNGVKRIYLNGELDAETTSSQNGSNLGDLWFGAAKGVTEYAPAKIDDVRIYSSALTGPQLADLITKGIEPSWKKAAEPIPADGTIGVNAPLLRWTAGETAVLHDVYLGASPTLTEADRQATRSPAALYYHMAGLQPGVTYYWRVDEIEKDGVTTHTGDVWSFMTQALTAYHPNPAAGANTTGLAPTLNWMAGFGAVTHHLYFSDDPNAVGQGAPEADQGTLAPADTTFVPGVLESLTTYYWRVDETTATGVSAGPVWSFTTARVLDDFESYNDEEGQGTRIYETWIDGWTNDTGSTVGNTTAPFAERTIIHEPNQAMPLDYNNIDAPFYSEAERAFVPAQDWTADDVNGLVLYVRGSRANDEAPLYVAIEDASGHLGVVVHPDPMAVNSAQWMEWKIPFQAFTDTGVNMSKVRKMFIGIGDKINPQKGDIGRIYVDDIRLTKPAS